MLKIKTLLLISILWTFHAHGQSTINDSKTPNWLTKKYIIAEEPDSRITCRSIIDGSLVWEYDAKHSIICRPTQYEGKVFFKTQGRDLICLDLLTGKLLWKKESPSFERHDIRGADGHIYTVESRGGLVSYDIKNGKERWRYNQRKTIYQLILIKYGNIVVFGDSGNRYGIDDNTGKLIWHRETEILYWGFDFNREAGLIYFTPKDEDLSAVDIKTGETRWKIDGLTSYDHSSDYGIMDQDEEGNLKFYDIKTGQLQWKRKFFEGYAYEEIIRPDITICYTRDDSIYAINTATGDLLWENKISNLDIDEIRRSGDKLYVSFKLDITYNHILLYSLDIKTGKVVWKTDKIIPEIYHWEFSDNAIVADDYNYSINIDPYNGKLKWVRNSAPNRCFRKFDTEKDFYSIEWDDPSYPYSYFIAQKKENSDVIWKKEFSKRAIFNQARFGDIMIWQYSIDSICGLDIGSGDVLWRTHLDTDAVVSDYYSQGDEFYFFGFTDLYALDLKTGKLNWKLNILERNIENVMLALESYDGSSRLIAKKNGEVLVFKYSNEIYAIDLKDHKIKWTYQNEDFLTDSLYLNNDRVICLGYKFDSSNRMEYELTGIEINSGKSLWKKKEKEPILIFERENELFYLDLEKNMQSINLQTGESKHLYTLDSQTQNFSSVNEVLFYELDKNIVAADLYTAEKLWDSEINNEHIKNIIYHEDVFYISTYDAIYAASANEGKQLWGTRTGPIQNNGIFVDDNAIYVYRSDGSGKILALNRKDGKVKWKYQKDPITKY